MTRLEALLARAAGELVEIPTPVQGCPLSLVLAPWTHVSASWVRAWGGRRWKPGCPLSGGQVRSSGRTRRLPVSPLRR